MISSAQIARRIKAAAKERGIILQDMLDVCGLSKNALASMTAGSYPKVDNLLKMAYCLDCSLDYLTGRTDNPEVNSCATRSYTTATL